MSHTGLSSVPRGFRSSREHFAMADGPLGFGQANLVDGRLPLESPVVTFLGGHQHRFSPRRTGFRGCLHRITRRGFQNPLFYWI